MLLIKPQIIAPDSSHWANWIDGAMSLDPQLRQAAQGLHEKLLSQGKIPFLSWHHLEELLCIENEARARRRVQFLQTLPLISWMQLPHEQAGPGAITDILAAEVIAVDAGCSHLVEVRDYVRQLIIRRGPGVDAIGGELGMWEVLRPAILARRQMASKVAALQDFRLFDEDQTVGQMSLLARRSPQETAYKMADIHTRVVHESMSADRRRTSTEARAIADEFVSDVLAAVPKNVVSTKEFITSIFVHYGVDPDEISDSSRLSDLSELATFRTKLRAIAARSGLPFERLKHVKMEHLPSWRITQALRQHGQQRTERPGSNLVDSYLAVLAAYTDTVYVDRRTHEDFRRVLRKEPAVAAIVGSVAKAARFYHIADV